MRIRTERIILSLGTLLVLFSPLLRAGDESRPNVLLITIDTLRTDRLSCYSREHVQTPVVDSLAERGVLFTKAFAHATTTLPSHVSILLGTTPAYHGVHDNGIFTVGNEMLTLAELLRDEGYETGAFIGAYPLDSRFGLDQGFDVYDDDYGSRPEQSGSYVERSAEAVVDRALTWLRQRKSHWFLWVHCYDPHDPYLPPEPFKSRYPDQPYDGEVAYVDQALTPLVDYLSRSALLDKTMIVVTGDHGEGLGEHGEDTHGYFAYNTTLHIPLIVSAPGIRPRKIDQVVSHGDIFPTVCDVVGARKPGVLQGESLLPLLKGKKRPEKPVYFESLYPYYSRGWAPLRGFIRDFKKFIESPIPELYDLNKDFGEQRNIIQSSTYGDGRRDLEKLMERLANPDSSPDAVPKTDSRVLAKLRSLGYVSGSTPAKDKKFGPRDDVKTLLPLHRKCTEAAEHFKQGGAERAIRELKEVITERDDVDVAYTNLAVIYRDRGRLGDAIQVLRLGRETLPQSYEIFRTLVNYLLLAGRNDEVISLITTSSLTHVEHDPEAWNYLGVAYSNSGQFDKAVEAFSLALELEDDYPVAYMNRGAAYLYRFFETKDGDSLRRAVENIERSISLDPALAKAHNMLGVAYRQSGELEKAIASWEKALAINPNLGDSLYNLGLSYLEKNDKPRALRFFQDYKDRFGRSLSDAERRKLEEHIQQCRKVT